MKKRSTIRAEVTEEARRAKAHASKNRKRAIIINGENEGYEDIYEVEGMKGIYNRELACSFTHNLYIYIVVYNLRVHCVVLFNILNTSRF